MEVPADKVIDLPIPVAIDAIRPKTVADFEARGWLGVMAPAGLAPEIRDKINESLRKAMAAEPFASSMAKLGLQPIGGTADDFGRFIASEYDRWGGVIKTGGIKAD